MQSLREAMKQWNEATKELKDVLMDSPQMKKPKIKRF